MVRSPGLRAEDAAAAGATVGGGGPLVFTSHEQLIDVVLANGLSNDRRALERSVVHNTKVRR